MWETRALTNGQTKTTSPTPPASSPSHASAARAFLGRPPRAAAPSLTLAGVDRERQRELSLSLLLGAASSCCGGGRVAALAAYAGAASRTTSSSSRSRLAVQQQREAVHDEGGGGGRDADGGGELGRHTRHLCVLARWLPPEKRKRVAEDVEPRASGGAGFRERHRRICTPKAAQAVGRRQQRVCQHYPKPHSMQLNWHKRDAP